MTGGRLSLATLYERSFRLKGKGECLGDRSARLSGSDSLEQLRSIAAAFREVEIGKGNVVAFLCRSSTRHCLSHFAVHLRGGITCNLHVSEPVENQIKVLEWLRPTALVFDEEFANQAGALRNMSTDGFVSISLSEDKFAEDDLCWNDLVSPAADESSNVGAGGDDLAAIILSSGSTGRPKGVLHSHQSLVGTAFGGNFAYGRVTRSDSTLLPMAPSFAAWPHVVLPFVLGGARLFFERRFSPDDFLESLATERVTIATAVPTMWRMILAESVERVDLSALSRVGISGEAATGREIDQLVSRMTPNIFNFYASAEAGMGAASVAYADDLVGVDGNAPVGRPVPMADRRIIDPDGMFDDELPPNETGEVIVSGPSLAHSYLGSPERTAECFAEGWWRTGDLGRVDDNGLLYIEGRLDNVINTGGIKVSAEEVEAAMLRCGPVTSAAVIGVQDERWGHRIEAYVTVTDSSVSEEHIRSVVAKDGKLSVPKIPKRIHIVSELPKGPTGKLYRRALRHHDEDSG